MLPILKKKGERGLPFSNITLDQHHKESTPADIPNMRDIFILVATEKRLTHMYR
jgi:hypothetical protein